METPNYLNIDSKYDTPTPYKNDYNFDEKQQSQKKKII